MYNAFEFGDMESDFINKHWDLYGAVLAEITVAEKSDVINPVVRNVIRHYFSVRHFISIIPFFLTLSCDFSVKFQRRNSVGIQPIYARVSFYIYLTV